MEQYTLFEFYYSPVEGSTENVNKNVFFHRHLKIIDCLTARVFFISTVNGRSKKKKRSLLWAALEAGHKQT